MLQRNIKQSINALEIFTRLECKINEKEVTVFRVNSYINIDRKSTVCIDIKHGEVIYYIKLNGTDNSLQIGSFTLPKPYLQEFTDEEFEDLKKRFIKIAQKHQDSFEQWIKDISTIDNVDFK